MASEDEFWLTLAPTNRLVSARNRQQLERLPGHEVVHRARASGDLSLFDPPADDELRFKVGAQIMMLNNDQGGRGKPVFSADDFFDWLASRGIVNRTMSRT